MTTLDELLHACDGLTVVHVERWVARGLLRPGVSAQGWTFERVDVARARLLSELAGDMGFDEEAVETVVDLLDQVHTLRRQLDLVGQAIADQPDPVRQAIAASLERLRRR
ncbi:MAG: chaperone modulator CbpM [Reyranellaceae bacterium]